MPQVRFTVSGSRNPLAGTFGFSSQRDDDMYLQAVRRHRYREIDRQTYRTVQYLVPQQLVDLEVRDAGWILTHSVPRTIVSFPELDFTQIQPALVVPYVVRGMWCVVLSTVTDPGAPQLPSN